MTLREECEKAAKEVLATNCIVDAPIAGDTFPDDPNFVLRVRSDAIADTIERVAREFAERALRQWCDPEPATGMVLRAQEVEIKKAIAAAERG